MSEGSEVTTGPLARTLTVLVVGGGPSQAVASRVGDATTAFEVATTDVEGVTAHVVDRSVDCIVLSPEDPGEVVDSVTCLRETAPGVPVVLLVDGPVDLEAAAEAGVTDVLEPPRTDAETTLVARKLEQYAAGYRARTDSKEEWAEAQFRSIFEHSPDMIAIHDEQGVIHNVNRRMCEKLGYDREELLGMTVSELEVGTDPADLETLWQGYEYGEPITVEGVNRRKDGTEFPVRVSLGRIAIEGEDLLLATIQDVHAEKERQRELERYERIVENVPIGVYRLRYGPDGTFEFVNPALVSILEGDSEVQLLERSLAELCADHEECERFKQRVLEGEAIVNEELELRTLRGESIWAAVTAIATVEDNGVYFDGVVVDVTERKRAERRLEASEAHLKQAQSVADIGSWYTDVPADEIHWSVEVYSIFGLPEATGTVDHEQFMACLHPDDRAFVEEQWTAALEGEPYDVEHRVVADGETRWVRERADVEFDEGGDPTRAIGIVQDITERKEYERRLEIHNEQLEVLNRIVRHDIRNQMNVVEGYARILTDSLEGDREDVAARIENAARELLSISEKIREVSDLVSGDPDRKPVDLSDLLEGALEDFQATYPECTVTASIPDTLWARATVRLEAAVANVLENAGVHSDAPSPEVTVSARENPERGEVIVRISDDGPGIPDKEYELLTGERDRSQLEHGSGLGLLTTNWIVADAGGDLEFAVDGGTTVTIRLPRAEPDV